MTATPDRYHQLIRRVQARLFDLPGIDERPTMQYTTSKHEAPALFLARIIAEHAWSDGDELQILVNQARPTSAYLTAVRHTRGMYGGVGVAKKNLKAVIAAVALVQHCGYGSVTFTFARGHLAETSLTLTAKPRQGEDSATFGRRLHSDYLRTLHERYPDSRDHLTIQPQYDMASRMSVIRITFDL